MGATTAQMSMNLSTPDTAMKPYVFDIQIEHGVANTVPKHREARGDEPESMLIAWVGMARRYTESRWEQRWYHASEYSVKRARRLVLAAQRNRK